MNMKSARPQILLLEDVTTDAPTDDDIAEYARALGINVKDEEDLVWIAREGLCASLPPLWRAIEDQPSGQIYYFNTDNGTSVWEHPLDTHYRQVVERERQNRLRRKCVEEVPVDGLANGADGRPPRTTSPYSVFRPPSPVPAAGNPPPRGGAWRARAPAPSPRSPLASPAGAVAGLPPWARPATPPPVRPLTNTSPSPTPTATASPTPSASPGESRRSNLNPPSSDTSSPPFNRPASPNAPPVPPKPQVTPEQLSALEQRRASTSFPADIGPLPERRPSRGAPVAAPPVPAKPVVQRPTADLVKEEEERLRRENEETIRKMREKLTLERQAEEKRMRDQLNEELRQMREKIAKEREGREKDLRNECANELKKVSDALHKERASQEKSVRDAMQSELQRLRDQLQADRTLQEQLLREHIKEELRLTAEALRKDELDRRLAVEMRERVELENLKKAMENEINHLQELHRMRVEEIRQKHAAELKQVEHELEKMHRELDKIKMEAADEQFFKKAQIEALEKQKGILENQIQDLRKQENEVKQQCEQLKDELKQLSKEMKQSQSALERLERQRTDMEEDMSFLQRAKQRYLERVDQLKTVVEEHLGPIAETTDDAAEEASLSDPFPVPEEAETEAAIPAANGPVETASNAVVNLDDPVSGLALPGGLALPTIRARSPQREERERPSSPSSYASIIRRQSSHRSLSPTTANGLADAFAPPPPVTVRNRFASYDDTAPATTTASSAFGATAKSKQRLRSRKDRPKSDNTTAS